MKANIEPLTGHVEVGFDVVDGETGQVKQRVKAKIPADRLRPLDPSKPMKLEDEDNDAGA